MTDRAARLGGTIQAELAELIRREVKDPRVQAAALITVTGVRVSPDLRYGDVTISVTGGETDAVVTALARAAGFLRGEIGRRLNLKRAPELRFHADRGAEHLARIEKLLGEDP